jgi:hypothetical protein
MLDRIRRFFDQHIATASPDVPAPRFGKGGGGDPAHGLHLATAALLAGGQPCGLPRARQGVVRHCRNPAAPVRFSDQETQELLEVARTESDEMLSLHPFVRLINEHFDAEARARIMEDLWQVAYADGKLDKHQEYTVRKIADLLYVPHSVYIRTKLKVEEGARDKMQEARDK